MDGRTPMFVRIDEYEDIQNLMNVAKKKLNQARATLNHISTLKIEEDTEIDRWSSTLEEVEKKIELIDRALFEQEG